jgi:hypothetical protein
MFPMCSVPSVSPLLWLSAWVFVFLLMVTSFFYVLNWGLSNGDVAFRFWILNFFMQCLIEFAVIQVTAWGV